MKKIYFLFFSLLLAHQISFAQWTQVGSPFPGFIVRGLFFNNVDTGYAAGASGNLAKTTDGGMTWTPQVSGVTTDLRSVQFIDNSTGYVSGAAGVVLKTTNGGSTWTLSNTGINTAYTIRAIDFISSDTGFAAASAGVIYKTTDAGATWTSYALGETTSDVIQLHMTDSQTGYAVCAGPTSPFNPGYVFKTSNGGNTWDSVYYDPNFGFLGLAVSNDLTVYAGGYQTIMKSDDGGATWDTSYTGLFNVIRGGMAVSQNVIYMVSDASYVLRTTDAGASWSDTVLLNGLYSIYFVDQVGYTGDGAGNVYKFTCVPPSPTITFLNGTLTSDNPTGNQWYRDGNLIAGAVNATYTPSQSGTYYTIVTNSSGCTGISNSIDVVLNPWTAVTSGVTNTLRGVYFINDSVGWVCGESSLGLAPILKTTNSGTSWSLINHPTAFALRAVHFVDANTGVIVGFNGTILRSTDGGSTWDSIPSGTIQPLRSVYFPSHDTGYACGGAGTILKTINSGQTWTAQVSGTTIDLINIRFISNDVGYAVQSDGTFLNGGVLKTTDGGATWSSVYTNAGIGLLGLSAVDANTVYAGGNNQTIFKSTNGGSNWNQVYTGDTLDNLRGSDFLDANTIWMVGGTNTSAILYTNDGGSTWINQTPLLGTFVELLGIHFPSVNVGFTVGTLGTILRYAPACAPPAAPVAIIGLDSVCSGNTEQYSIDAVSGADSYNWSVPADAVILSGQGTTVIKLTFGTQSGQISVTSVSNQCGSGGTISINVTVNPTPAPSITFSNNILTSSEPAGNQWYLDGVLIPGATDDTYTPSANGNYSVVVTNSFGCSGTSNSIDVIGLGIGSTSVNSMTIFPNPATDQSTIYFPKVTGGKLQLVNAAGVIEFSENNLEGEFYKVNTAALASGLYLIRVYDQENNLKATARLIVQ